MTRALNKRRARIAAELTAPLPPVAETLVMLEALATHEYETKARTLAALKLAHRTLRDLLQTIEVESRYPALISRTAAEGLHRRLRRSMELDKPKRFPALPRLRTPLPPATLPEVAAAATTPPIALPRRRATALLGDEGIEFDESAPGGVEREEDEAPLLCAECVHSHMPGQLRPPCATPGCQCWCNR